MAEQVTTSQIDPALRPFLTQGLERAQELFLTGPQPTFFPRQTYISPSEQTLSALAAQESLARQASPVLSEAQSAFLRGVTTPSAATPMYQDIYGAAGMRPGASVFEQAAAGQLAPSAARFQNLYGAAGGGVPGLFGQVSGGGFQNIALPGTAQTAAGSFLMGSPYQQALIEQSVRPITRQLTESTLPGIQSAFSRAGRYGSGAQTRAIESAVEAASRAAGDVATQIGAGTYAQERGFQESALGRLGALSQQDLANRLQAAQMAESTRQAQIAQQAGLAGQIAGLEQQGIGTRLAGASALEQAQQAALSGQLAATGGIAATQQADLARQLAAAQAAPSFFQMGFLPSQALAQVGAQREAIAMQPLQEEMARFQFQQQLPQQQLASYLSSVYGTPLGSYGTQTTQLPQNQLMGGVAGAGLGYLGGQALGSFLGGTPFSLTSPTGYGLGGAAAGGLLGFFG